MGSAQLVGGAAHARSQLPHESSRGDEFEELDGRTLWKSTYTGRLEVVVRGPTHRRPRSVQIPVERATTHSQGSLANTTFLNRCS